MGITCQHILRLLLSLCLFICWTKPSRAEPQEAEQVDSNVLMKAQEEFSRGDYRQAVIFYRKWLRANPQDSDEWTHFAAAYYHTGHARQALAYLKKFKPYPKLRPFNIYYQALCLNALGDQRKARRYLTKVSRLDDPIADDALFELAALEFDEGRAAAAQKAAEEYLSRFRNGKYRAQAEFIISMLAFVGKVEIPGSQNTLYKTSFYKHHPMSLFDIAHSWFYQFGYYLENGTRTNPDFGTTNTINTGIPYQELKLVMNAGLGFGPFKSKGSESYAGYVYEQDWNSDPDRIAVWSENFLDIQYFPFRADLLERRHRFYFESFGDFSDFRIGFYGHWQFNRAGSAYFPAPERPEIRKSFDTGVENLFVPWIDWRYKNNHSLKLYLPLRKHIDREQSDFSYETYSLIGSSREPFLSYSLLQSSRFPSFLDMRFLLEIFQHRFDYNDFWESYTALGLATRAEVDLGTSFRFGTMFGYSTNTYINDAIRSSGCRDVTAPTPFGIDSETKTRCSRIDKIMTFGVSGSFFMQNQKALSLLVHYKDRKNDILAVYDESAFDVLILFSQAFPTLNIGTRYKAPYLGVMDLKGPY